MTDSLSPLGRPGATSSHQLQRCGDDLRKTADKTNHLANLCFAASALFMGLSFYDGYCFFSERTVSLFLRGIFWALVATIIGTAGEILLKVTREETPIVPRTIYTPSLHEGRFPGIPNVGNTCFINAPTQAIMADDLYYSIYKTTCEQTKVRLVRFKNFLDLYPAQSGFFAWPKILSWKREVEPPLTVVNTRDVLVMLMMRKSGLNCNSKDFLEKYPIIHRLIGEFSKITKDADFPEVPDNNVDLRQEFALMKDDSDIVKFFDQERIKVANEILGFDAFLHLIQAYEDAVKQKLPVVSFGTWFSTPIGNIRHLISGAGGFSQADVGEFLLSLFKYVMPDDYPLEVFFPRTDKRIWEECPENEQVAEHLQELLEKHRNPRGVNDLRTQMPSDKKIEERFPPVQILQINGSLYEGVCVQMLLNEMFEVRQNSSGSDDPNKTTAFYLDSTGLVRNYYLVSEEIAAPTKMPERIILELMRYETVNDEYGRRREKIECAVNMPPQINICGQPYVLKSIVLHSGEPDKGHYYTIVNKDDKWWYASDSTVNSSEEVSQLAEKEGRFYFYAKES